MAITTVSSRELNQDIGKAKRAATQNPVVINDRGKPAFVLLSYTEYQRLSGASPGRNLVEALSMPGLSGFDFDPPKADTWLRPADFS
ncbi:type II toxin-antitoxin system Phd/YefM family antitoxin [Niveispirillum sp.]|uniref:type II toxin-antitoxin system Phd/YefM family antitoxin n=1 Tax=Niveispirillum sp. TaxID=1917217 RepID=UPI001B52C8F6|nr:type II toxin-antitoxin system Phd/YefM family antitoxin [Niveispirillum sp.]MBP7338171.1 type II toxin-antitoxin system Phd/YefM family antitoxin [Niveispirillum sp.]